MRDYLNSFLSQLLEWLPFVFVLGIGILVLIIANYLFFIRQKQIESRNQLSRQLLMLFFTGIVIVSVVIAMPISDAIRGQLFGLLGILVTAAVALSSTTFVGNAMAGLMLRAVKSFRPGDFLRVSDTFGRVTEKGLLHTEIQTEDRDLTTLPNLYLVTNPITVVRSSGTIISASLSLGYDISHNEIEGHLIEAAKKTELEDPFVQIIELGDFSVTYRISGFLTDVKVILSKRSQLKANILDELHESHIEIVSPNFMNQRQLSQDTKVIPKQILVKEKEIKDKENVPEKIIFDKAEEAESKENLKKRFSEIEEKIKTLEAKKTLTPEKTQIDELEKKIENLEKAKLRIIQLIESIEEKEKQG